MLFDRATVKILQKPGNHRDLPALGISETIRFVLAVSLHAAFSLLGPIGTGCLRQERHHRTAVAVHRQCRRLRLRRVSELQRRLPKSINVLMQTDVKMVSLFMTNGGLGSHNVIFGRPNLVDDS